MGDLLDYYSRKDVQKALVEFAKNREVAVVYKEGNFGKRPDILQYEGDVLELARNGAISFHFSEEHWSNPLALKSGMTKTQLDNLRIGFDFIVDIDSKNLEQAKIAASLIINALEYYNIENISVKFSGNLGFHIGIPFKSFPNKILNQDTVLLFPDSPRVIAAYLKEMIKEPLGRSLGKKDPFSVLDIDTILISSRHMFRAPYSYNEKSGLISLPIDKDDVLKFNRDKAKMENVKVDVNFLDNFKANEAKNLVQQAFDWQLKKEYRVEIGRKEFELPKTKVKEEYFPPCIEKILKGLKDGKKRSLFILNNFLKNLGYNDDEIKVIIEEWNKKNPDKLREAYIKAQLSWHNRQKQRILPPNCDNLNYYKGIGICIPDNLCKKIKNPVNYSLRRLRIVRENLKEIKHKKI